MYIAPGRGRQPLGDKILMSTERPYHCPFSVSFINISLKSDFITFLLVFIHVYSPGAGADNPLGSEFLCKHIPHVILVICCKFLPLNDFLTVFSI